MARKGKDKGGEKINPQKLSKKSGYEPMSQALEHSAAGGCQFSGYHQK
jgi:hypothetical protein